MIVSKSLVKKPPAPHMQTVSIGVLGAGVIALVARCQHAWSRTITKPSLQHNQRALQLATIQVIAGIWVAGSPKRAQVCDTPSKFLFPACTAQGVFSCCCNHCLTPHFC